MSIGLSLIIPVLDEKALLPELVAQIESIQADQTIIIDGGSSDGSWEWLTDNWQGQSEDYVLMRSAMGRAPQMNAGAQEAEHDVLLFLHADTQLPLAAKQQILDAASRSELKQFWGRFDVRFTSIKQRSMQIIAFFINLRSRLSSVATGDQAIFVSSYLFDLIQGFEEIEIMEDVAFSKKLRKIAKPLCLRSTVISSARRWERNGVVTTVIQMWAYRLAFLLGIEPARLKRGYRNVR